MPDNGTEKSIAKIPARCNYVIEEEWDKKIGCQRGYWGRKTNERRGQTGDWPSTLLFYTIQSVAWLLCTLLILVPSIYHQAAMSSLEVIMIYTPLRTKSFWFGDNLSLPIPVDLTCIRVRWRGALMDFFNRIPDHCSLKFLNISANWPLKGINCEFLSCSMWLFIFFLFSNLSKLMNGESHSRIKT